MKTQDKKCTKCRLIKSSKEFYRDSNSKDGLNYVCKTCIKDKNSKHYQANKNRIRNKIERWKLANPSLCKENNKKYRKTNKTKIVKKQIEWRENNRVRCNLANKKWESKNQDKVRAKARRRRARKKAVNESFSYLDEQKIYNLFNNKCFSCRSKTNLCIDHFKPLSKGNALTLTNAIILCMKCNNSKSNKDPQDFFNINQLEHVNRLFVALSNKEKAA